MVQTEKRNRFLVLALVVLAAVIVFLTIRNDFRFREREEFEANMIARQDSLECKQMECMSSMLEEATVQLGSVRRIQKRNNEIEAQNNESIKKSLNQIVRTAQQILNSMK
jgi:membrane-associated HD superfamily phosphohydrolase